MLAAYSGQPLDYRGEQVSSYGYTAVPPTIQRPHPPIMIGGGAPKVLALAHVSNVLGTENPLAEISAMAHEAGAIVEVVVCAIDRSPEGENPLADVGLTVRAVLTKTELDAARG